MAPLFGGVCPSPGASTPVLLRCGTFVLLAQLMVWPELISRVNVTRCNKSLLFAALFFTLAEMGEILSLTSTICQWKVSQMLSSS